MKKKNDTIFLYKKNSFEDEIQIHLRIKMKLSKVKDQKVIFDVNPL